MSDPGIKFGPEWMRALTGGGGGPGGCGNTMMPNPSPVVKNKPLAEHRYNREKMLELFVPMSWPPETLINDQDSINEVELLPLATTPLTQEEQRMWSRNINSDMAVRMMGGAGGGPAAGGRGGGGMNGGGGGLSHSMSTSSLMSRGRGGSMDRGRLRGRGGSSSSSYYTRGNSHEEDMEPIRMRESGPPGMSHRRGGAGGYERSTSLSTGLGSGPMGAWGTPPNLSDHPPPAQVVNYQGPLEHSSSRGSIQEERMGATSPRKEQGRASTENWRNRDGSSSGDTTLQEYWRTGQGGANVALNSPAPGARIDQGKWANSRNVASTNGWRPREPFDEVNYNSTNTYYNNSRGGRSTSNLQQGRTRAPWDNGGGRRNWGSIDEDRLPEWATDLSHDRAGSFDSSGAYHSAWSNNGAGGEEKEMVEKEDGFNQRGGGGLLHSTHNNSTNSMGPPPNINGSGDLSSISTASKAVDKSVSSSSSTIMNEENSVNYSMVNGHPSDGEKFGSHPNKPPECSVANTSQPPPPMGLLNGYRVNDPANSMGIVYSTGVDGNMGGMIPQSSIANSISAVSSSAPHSVGNEAPVHHTQPNLLKKIDAMREDDELLNGADDFVSKLVDDEPKSTSGGPTNLDTSHPPPPRHIPPPQQGGMISQPPPQQSIGGADQLQNNKQGGGRLEDGGVKWFYTDPQQNVQGPFEQHQMLNWFNSGYFADTLLIKRDCDDKFMKLADIIKYFGRLPFLPGTPAPPIKEIQDVSSDLQQQHAREMEKYEIARCSYTMQKQVFDQQILMRQQQILQQLQQISNYNKLNEEAQKQLFMQQLILLQQQHPLIEPVPPPKPQLLMYNNSSTPPVATNTPPPIQQQARPPTSMQMTNNFSQLPNMHQNVLPINSMQTTQQQTGLPVNSIHNSSQQQSSLHSASVASSLQMPNALTMQQHGVSPVDPIRDLMNQLNSTAPSSAVSHPTNTPPPSQIMMEPPLMQQSIPQQNPLASGDDNPLQKLLLQIHQRGGSESKTPSPPSHPEGGMEGRRKEEEDVLASFVQQMQQQQKEKNDVMEENRVLEERKMKERREKEQKKEEELQRLKEEEMQRKKEEELKKKQADAKKREEEKKLKQKQKQEEALKRQEENKRKQEERKREMEERRREQEAAEERKRLALEEERKRMHRIEQEEKQAMALQLQQMETARAQQQQQRVWSDTSGQSNTPSLLEIQKRQQEKERLEKERLMKEEEIRKYEMIREAAERKKNANSMTLKWAANKQPSNQSHGNQSVKSLIQIQQEEEKENKKRLSREEKSVSASTLSNTLSATQKHWGSTQQAMSWANRASSTTAPSVTNAAAPAKAWNDSNVWTNNTNTAPNNGNSVGGGFWESAVLDNPPVSKGNSKANTNNTSRITPTKPAANNKKQPQTANNKTANKQQQQVNKKKKDEDTNKKNASVSISPLEDFNKWCKDTLASLRDNPESIDVPTFIGFLREVESPYEVHDYIRNYLGDAREVKEFAKNYLERRSKMLNATRRKNNSRDDILAPAPAINPASDGFQDGKGRDEKWTTVSSSSKGKGATTKTSSGAATGNKKSAKANKKNGQ